MRRSPWSVRSMFRGHAAWLLALLSLLTVVIAAVPQPAAAAVPVTTFQTAPCPIAPIGDIAVDCGYLVVPESHNDFDGTVLRLFTVILRTPNPTPAPDPAVFLQGGPGGAATFLAATLADAWRPILNTRDLILLDQRGTGRSLPGLFCPPLDGARLPSGHPVGTLQHDGPPAGIARDLQLYTACGENYAAAGVDLTKFNSAENAADIEDLRRTLGYSQLNLVGASYGTNLALEALRYRSPTIRSVVLDSVIPPQNHFTVESPASFNHALTQLAGGCAADAACNAAYGDLLDRWDRLVARLDTTPVQLPIVNVKTNELITYLPVNGWDLTSVLFNTMYSTANMPVLPFLIGEASNGNYEPLSRVFSLLVQPSDGPPEPRQSSSAELQYFATLCFDDYPFVTADDFIRIRSANLRGQPLSGGLAQNETVKQLCAALGLGVDVPSFVNTAVTSSVPTFLIAGQYDPIAPSYNAFSAAATLSAGMPVVVYPHGGHTPSVSSRCLARAIGAFLDDPYTPPDTSCLAAEPPPPFLVGPQARAALDAIGGESGSVAMIP